MNDKQQKAVTWAVILALVVAVGWLGVQQQGDDIIERKAKTKFASVIIDHDLDVDGTLNADDFDIDLSAEFEIDGGLVDIGGGTGGTADGDNDLLVAGDLEVDTSLVVDGLTLPSFADLTVTDGYTLTAAYTTYALDSAGAVTITLAATGTEGQYLTLIGDDANDIIIADTNIRTSTGNALTINQYDVVMFVFQDSEWLELLLITDS